MVWGGGRCSRVSLNGVLVSGSRSSVQLPLASETESCPQAPKVKVSVFRVVGLGFREAQPFLRILSRPCRVVAGCNWTTLGSYEVQGPAS